VVAQAGRSTTCSRCALAAQITRSNLQWIRKEDHRFKTLVDVRECRKARKNPRDD
jgi:hypothetical protein